MKSRSTFVEVDGLRMHLLEQGEGPLVVLCHGFPETGFSWRHQLAELGQAGYHVVAPDQRGYGKTDRPPSQDSYTLCHLAGDLVGLVHALGEEQAAIVGHDWGAAVAWTCALLRPDIFRAVGLLSVPYLADIWTGPPPTVPMRQMLSAGHMFYQLYFQEPGKADAELANDVRDTLLRLFYSLSSGIPSDHRWRADFSPHETFRDSLTSPDHLPPWLTEKELSVFVEEFQQTGFTGALNWYRNLDRDRELLGFLARAKIQQPSLFLAGDEDALLTIYEAAFNSLEKTMPNLIAKVRIPSAGHWVQQEKPQEVNHELLRFFSSAWPNGRSGRS